MALGRLKNFLPGSLDTEQKGAPRAKRTGDALEIRTQTPRASTTASLTQLSLTCAAEAARGFTCLQVRKDNHLGCHSALVSQGRLSGSADGHLH